MVVYTYQGFRTTPRTIPKHYLFVRFPAIERLSHTPESDWCIVCREISDIFLAKRFKVTLLSPSWRSLNLPKGSLPHPKKVTKNCLEGVILHYFASLTVLSFFQLYGCQVDSGAGSISKNSRRLQVTLNGREKQYVNTSAAGFPGFDAKIHAVKNHAIPRYFFKMEPGIYGLSWFIGF